MPHASARLHAYPKKLVKALSRKFTGSSSVKEKKVEEATTKSWHVIGVTRTLTDDFQHICMELAWGPLLSLVLVVYAAVSVLFAWGFYMLTRYGEGQHLAGDRFFKSDFEEFLWMSVGNLVTIGYGALVPASRAAYVLATLEHFAGILLSAILLGIVVSKASLPTARIVFSDNVIFTRRNGEPAVLFRVGNTRGNFLLNPEVRVSYFRPVTTVEGENIWTGVRVDFEEPPQLAPAFNLVHMVTEDSPFYGLTQTDLEERGGSLSISIGATDDHSLQTLFARKFYSKDNVVFNMRFGDVMQGTCLNRTVDFRKFNDMNHVKGLPEWTGYKIKGT